MAKLACSSQVSLMYIYAQCLTPNQDLLDKLIKQYVRFSFNDDLFGLIWAFFQFISPTRSNFTTVLNQLRNEFFDCNAGNVRQLIKLLELMFSEKKHNVSEPITTFLFNGPSSGISVDCQTPWPFHKGFSLCCWVNIQEFP